MEDKTQFTLKHVQMLYQTLADILTEKYVPNIKIVVKVRKKEETMAKRGNRRRNNIL